MDRRDFALAGSLLALALAAFTAGAKGKLQVRPTLIELPPGKSAGRVVLANTGDQPVLAQVRVYAWTQQAGEDRLVASEQIAVSPPLAKIAPGGEQLVRLVRKGAGPVGRDQSYRLVVDELPGAKTGGESAVSMRLRYVMPLFVRAAEAPAPALTCRLASAVLACDNLGGQAAQLGRSRLIDAEGHAVELSEGLFGYVLPGSLKQWTLDSAKVSSLGADLRMESQLNGQSATVSVVRSP